MTKQLVPARAPAVTVQINKRMLVWYIVGELLACMVDAVFIFIVVILAVSATHPGLTFK